MSKKKTPKPEPPDPGDYLMNTKDAVEYLRVTRSTLYSWIKQGIIPVIRMKKQILRFRRRDLEAFVNSSKLEPKKPEGVVPEPVSVPDEPGNPGVEVV